tara:strand:- start:24768 stop:25901 length:1134 start_codon:yes stop_codon:yes gene_type:complete
MSEEIKETAGGELTQGDFKIKKKPKKLITKDDSIKVDLSQKKENVEEPITKVNLKTEDKEVENKVEDKVEDLNPISEIEPKEVETEKEIKKELELKKDKVKRIVELPEDLNKLVKFMEETGGSVQDYARLNRDYSNVDEKTLLREYYKSTKPHLNTDEVDFIMEDKFDYDEEIDEERDIKKKKLAMKEEIAKAKNFLEDVKNKYYEEIKLKSNVTEDQKKAMDFFNRYNEEQEIKNKQHENFVNNTKEYFSKDFKGFEFNLGEKSFKYGVNNIDEVIKEQSSLQNFVGKFLNKDGDVTDQEEYHKALYAARNADTIAKHFYEQGKADGIKNIVDKSKNIDTANRPQNNEDIFINGFKVKAISGIDSSKLKIKTKKIN